MDIIDYSKWIPDADDVVYFTKYLQDYIDHKERECKEDASEQREMLNIIVSNGISDQVKLYIQDDYVSLYDCVDGDIEEYYTDVHMIKKVLGIC